MIWNYFFFYFTQHKKCQCTYVPATNLSPHNLFVYWINNTEDDLTKNNVLKLLHQRDTLASNYIYATVTDKMREYFINCETSEAMWSRLSTRFTLRSIANKGQLWFKFYEYQFSQSQDMLANITSVEGLVR